MMCRVQTTVDTNNITWTAVCTPGK